MPLGSDDVGVQVVPFQTSADPSAPPVPDEPPATSTCAPFSTIAEGSSVAVWSCRRALRVPAEAQVPEPVAALNSSVVFRVVGVELVDRPPATSRFPFASAVAVWPSQAFESAVRPVHVDTPS